MPIDQDRLHRMLNPKSVVVVGDKGPNYQWLTNQKEFPGKLYSVQVDPNEIKGIEERGFQNFTSLADIPEPVDLLICAVPRQVAPRIVVDAIANNVGGIAMYTAGFAETHEDLGIQLQERIVSAATEAGMPIVGPNCMGIYNRRLGIRFSAEQQHAEGGNVAFVSQSGAHGANLTLLAQAAGLQVTRTISIGNAAILNEADYIEYLATDNDTQFIGMYLEGVKDGRRFFNRLREVTKTKPVIIWKGGNTEIGSRATRSHTASLATPAALWESMVRQAGAIHVQNVDEMIDTMATIVRIPRTTGREMGLLAMSGGQSVAITDSAGRAGLNLPALSDESYSKLSEFFNIIGGSYRNPFDMGGTIGIRGAENNLARILEIIAADPALDAAIYEMGAGQAVNRNDPDRFKRALDAIDKFRSDWGKPVIMVCHPGANPESYNTARTELLERNYPVIPSFDRAAQAYARVANYWTTRGERGA